MQRINNPPGNLFIDGDSHTGIPGTKVNAAWLNTLQEEVVNVVVGMGIGLDGQDDSQLFQAILALVDASTLDSGSTMLFGNNSPPTGWTRKTDWQDNAMFCFAANGNIGAGGAVNPQAAHHHATQGHGLTADENGPHSHPITSYTAGGNGAGGHASYLFLDNQGPFIRYTDPSGNGTPHDHGDTTDNLAPYYQELIAATKD